MSTTLVMMRESDKLLTQYIQVLNQCPKSYVDYKIHN